MTVVVVVDFRVLRLLPVTMIFPPGRCRCRRLNLCLQADKMKSSASRRLAVLFVAFMLPIGGCAGTGGGKQKCAGYSGTATTDAPAVAGHSEQSQEPTVQLVGHTSEASSPPIVAPAVLPARQGLPAESETVPLPSTVEENAAADEQARQISLSSALAAVSGQNPQVAYASEQINEALAQLRGARTLWLPSIRAGIYYGNHEGPLQANDGTIPITSRSALEAGLGMAAVGGGSPAVPGVAANFQVADVVFQPRIADQEVAARQHATRATTHDLLLSVALAYLDLLRAFQQQAIAQETLNHTEQLVELTTAFARTGQGNQADADRAQTELTLRKNLVAQAVAQTQVASARLAELLNMAPTCIFVPQEPAIVPISLVPRDARVAQLVAEGLSCRPELGESRHLVAEAVHRLEREQYAPLLPSVLLGISQGGYGGGPGDTMADFAGRFDLDATAYWQIRNFRRGRVGRPRSRPFTAGASPTRPGPAHGSGGPRGRRSARPIGIAPSPD